MSTDGNATTAIPAQQGAANGTTTASRRQQVMLGDLPDDFLRSGRSQEQEDERIAHILQAQQQAGFYQPVPSNVVGRLAITIVQAKLNKNYGLTKMDPYCRVRLGHVVFETPTAVNGAKNPRWNKTVQTYLPQGVDSMYVEIFDERSFTMDDRVAWGVITIPPAVMTGETVDEWSSLSGRLGDGLEGSINIVLTLTPMSSIPQPSYVTTYTTPLMMPVYYPQAPGQPAAYPQQPGAVPQQQPPPQPQMTEEDLQQVKDMFPNMEDQVIKSVFEANNGNKDATINSLLSMNSE
ncbi:toll-interacting protein-like [Babylonia areolata]|uniref:toll-interacting protein-like n=1 Tax=Babylonia areolata TaxID=304850 RepID=UPI003FD26F15